jgi:Kae1-associated kinase Bud32
MNKRLAQGAEAIIYSDGSVVEKDRFEKGYRHPALDMRLRKSRTRREGKILGKLAGAGIAAPELVEMDDKSMKVRMSHVPGEMVKVVVDDLEEKDMQKDFLTMFASIGKKVGQLHDNGIVHQDLTTSNMIVHAESGEVYLIDFGLSFFSDKIEDYAVDLHLLRHALESRHYRIWEECFEKVCEAYREEMEMGDAVLKRLEVVEKRGRYKGKH